LKEERHQKGKEKVQNTEKEKNTRNTKNMTMLLKTWLFSCSCAFS
jgi:hypothetical protein